MGASGAISGVLGAYLAIFPRAKIFQHVHDAWTVLLENDAHRSKMVFAVLVCIPKYSTVCPIGGFGTAWRRRGVYGAYWRFCCWICGGICIQKNV